MYLYRVQGTTSSGKSKELYIRASSIHIAEKRALDTSVGEGGFASWSTELLEELPGEALIKCPHCSEKFDDPRVVVSVN